MVVPLSARELAFGAQVVLHVAGSLHGPRIDVALELAEDLRVGLADHVGEHVQPTAVRHADTDLFQAEVRGLLADLVQQGDGGLPALQAEALLPDELGLQERLEDLGLVQLVQDPEVLLARQRLVRALDAILDPLALRGLLDVHVLDADGAAVGVAQDAQDLAHLHQALAAGERAGGELPIEVPQRQPVGLHIEIVVAPLAILQRVGVGHQVTAHPVGVDHLHDPGLLGNLVLVTGADILRPADRLVRDPQAAEDVVVEPVLTEQQVVQPLQVLTGHGALDDAVVVGGRQRHHLGDAHVGELVRIRALELRRILHRTDADDASLALHQPRHRVVGADRAGVGQGDGGAGEVLDPQLAGSRLLHHLLVRGPELREVQRLAVLDARHQKLPGPVLLGQVDGQAEVHVLRDQHGRLALDLLVAVVHGRHALQRLHHGEADQMRVRDLAAAGPPEMVVDHHALVDQQLDRKRPDAGRGRHRERDVHVLGGSRRGAAQDDPLRFLDVHVGPDRGVRRIGRYAAAGAWRRRPALGGLGRPFHRRRTARGGRSTRRSRLRGCLSGCRCRSRGGRRLGHLGLCRSRLLGLRRLCRGRLAIALTVSRPATRFGLPSGPGATAVAGARRAVRLEVRHPALVDRAGVSGVLLVHLLQQPVVRSEVGVFTGAGGCLVGHGGHCRLLPRVHVAGVDPPSTYAQAGHSLGYPRSPTRERLVTCKSNVA